MPIVLKRTDRKDFTKIVCPDCGQRAKGIGLLKESKVDGLTIECHKCKSTWEIKSE